MLCRAGFHKLSRHSRTTVDGILAAVVDPVDPHKEFRVKECPITGEDMEMDCALPCGHMYSSLVIIDLARSGLALNCPECRKPYGHILEHVESATHDYV